MPLSKPLRPSLSSVWTNLPETTFYLDHLNHHVNKIRERVGSRK